jgi:hypothetical protein
VGEREAKMREARGVVERVLVLVSVLVVLVSGSARASRARR